MNAPVEKAERSWPLGLGQRDLLPNLYDLIVFIIIGAGFVALAHGAREMGAPLAQLDIAPVTLDLANLPEYALRTTLRMFAAIFASLAFTFVVATLAAKSRKAELVIVPALAAPEWVSGIARQSTQTAAKPPMTVPCEALFRPPEKCYGFSAFVQHLRE